MNKITLQSIDLLNFKGIKELFVNFNNVDTIIYGRNRIGKTTILDAFIWLLFNKDSTDRKDFQIKTQDSQGNYIPKLDHAVTAIIKVNEKEKKLKRLYREIWETKKGSDNVRFTGHETLYYQNLFLII